MEKKEKISHRCPTCNKNLNSLLKFSNHLKECLKRYNEASNGDLDKEDIVFKCTKCHDEFNGYDAYIKHAAIHIEQISTCNICGENFTLKYQFNKHTKTCKAFEAYRIRGKLGMKYKCPECPFKTADASKAGREVLRVHMTGHRKSKKPIINTDKLKTKKTNKKIKCGLCSYVTISNTYLKTHMWVHEGPYKCKTCYVGFCTLNMLNRHIKICSRLAKESKDWFCPTVEDLHKPFRCVCCSARFMNSCGLNNHLRSNKAKCFVYYSSSPTKLQLKRPKNPEKAIQGRCKICDKKTASAGSTRHYLFCKSLKEMYGDAYYPPPGKDGKRVCFLCTKCGKSFKTHKYYRNHIASQDKNGCCMSRHEIRNDLKAYEGKEWKKNRYIRFFQCPHCPLKSRMPALFEKHFDLHKSGVKEPSCQFCGVLFENDFFYSLHECKRIRYQTDKAAMDLKNIPNKERVGSSESASTSNKKRKHPIANGPAKKKLKINDCTSSVKRNLRPKKAVDYKDIYSAYEDEFEDETYLSRPINEQEESELAIQKVLAHSIISETHTNASIGNYEFKVQWKGQSPTAAEWKSFDQLIVAGISTSKVEAYFNGLSEQEKKTKTDDFMPSIERVLSHQIKNRPTKEYLVKWEGEPYANATWEKEETIEKIAKPAIDAYKKRQLLEHKKMKEKVNLFLNKRRQFGQNDIWNYVDDVNPKLLDFQKRGVMWLVEAWEFGKSVILADEMGLGKTVQTVCFLRRVFDSYKMQGPCLIIVPLSTISGWKKTFEVWAPDINVVVYHGTNESLQMIKKTEGIAASKTEMRLNCHVIITTPEMILKDNFLSNFPWAILVFDEAQRIKDEDTILHQRLTTDYTSHFRLLLTGTPINNKIDELWTLLNFMMPAHFDDKDAFIKQYEKCGNNPEKLIARVAPFVLRRIKSEVNLNIPPKSEKLLHVPMTMKQAECYNLLIRNSRDALEEFIGGKIGSMANVMMKLRQCCGSVDLIKTEGNDGNFEDMLNNSGKLQLLDQLFTRLFNEKHRVLVFSQFIDMLELVEKLLTHKTYKYSTIHGSTAEEERSHLIKEFNASDSDTFCFLLSTRAGGVGINLTAADTVIMLDFDWNPHQDLQAIARAHRIGQTRPVTVYRLMHPETIDEVMFERSQEKMKLHNFIFQCDENIEENEDIRSSKVLSKVIRQVEICEDAFSLDCTKMQNITYI